MPTLLNRSDLLACLRSYGTDSLDRFAEIMDFAVVEPQKKTPRILQGSLVPGVIWGATLETLPSERPHAGFLRIVSHRRFKEEDFATDEPEWFRSAQPFIDDDPALKAPVGLDPPRQQALLPWPRLWPFLKLALGAKMSSYAPDMPKAVDCVARGRVLRRLPRSVRKGWASQAQLIIDYDKSLLPFWNDFNSLHEKLADLRGLAGFTVMAFPDGDPGGRCWMNTSSGWKEVGAYQPPDADHPVLILSDLGCNDANEYRRLCWRQFGKQLVRAGCRAVALMPSPPRWWSHELTRLFIPVYWDRAVRLPQRLARNNSYQPDGNEQREDKAAERLLTVLATAVRVEPALLRAARLLFPAQEMDIGAEFAAWNHPAVHPTHLAFYFDSAKIPEYRNRFRGEPHLTQEVKQRAADLIQMHHAHLSPVITYEEQLAKAELLNEPSPDTAQTFAEGLAKTLSKPQGEINRLSKQWLQRMGARQHPSLWKNDALSVAWIKAHAEEDLSSFPLPEGLTPEKFSWALKQTSQVRLQIRQWGEELVFSNSESAAIQGSRIGEIESSSNYFQIESDESEKMPKSTLNRRDRAVSLVDEHRFTIRTDREEVQFDWLKKPEWASAIGRDTFGLYADFEFKGIVQRFRWINPGEFLMGSPIDELDRSEGELQHPVTLTQGFWLADSACTQALWAVVMGENPSRVWDDQNNPVENVSWDDAMQFIARLTAAFPDLLARLPTEAEWEYACRAGTKTPFAFGETITRDQVNYDSDFPNVGYGRYRKTVPVKSLPPNPWGLYEMHGNVWEWCADWYGDYSAGPTVDPLGPEQGSYRVLRGGSWIMDVTEVRSASRQRNNPSYRIRYDPLDRDFGLGFRLALGRIGASGPAGPARGTAAGRTAAAERGGERIHKILARTGRFGSLRSIGKDLIGKGRITINGRTAKLGDRCFPEDRIEVDGTVVVLPDYAYLPDRLLLYYKAEGELVTQNDPENRPTVFDHLPRLELDRWVAVGGMDIGTQGLLLFTTNGELADRLNQILKSIECAYAVRVLGEISDEKLLHLIQGINLEGEVRQIESIEFARGDGANRWYRLVLGDGRNGVVRSLLKSQGIICNRIIRIRLGNIVLPKDMKPHSYTELSLDQLAGLMELVGLPS
jgi:pseudouridine synthase